VDLTRSTPSGRGMQGRSMRPVIESTVACSGAAAVVAEVDALSTQDVQWVRELS